MSFKHKIHLAISMLVATLLLIAGLFYSSADRYQHHLERNELAHSVLDGYLVVSEASYRTLAELTIAVSVNGKLNLADTGQQQAASQAAEGLAKGIAELEQTLAAEAAFLEEWPTSSAPTDGDIREQQFQRLKAMVANVLASRAEVLERLQQQDQNGAEQWLLRLKELLVEGQFSETIAAAVGVEQALVKATDMEAANLRSWIAISIPTLVVFVALLAWFFSSQLSRRLNGSVGNLEVAARAFSSGDLSHRVGEVTETEFQQLSDTLNTMAAELERRREDEKQLQAQLERQVAERTAELKISNDALLQASKTRRQLLADIGHELRTPLTIISGEAQLSLRQARKQSADVFSQPLQQILEQTEHTSRLVDDLLFIARAEAQQPGLSTGECDMADIVRSAVLSFQQLAESKSIALTADIPKMLPLVADAHRLRQVVAVLLDNALRYGSSKVHCAAELGADNVEVLVSNDGSVIPAADADRVFERFYRGGDSDVQSRIQGSGLGLAIAKAIVVAHRGTINFIPIPAGGAEIRVSLPLVSKIEEHHANPDC